MRNFTAALAIFMLATMSAATFPDAARVAAADNVLVISRANTGGSGAVVLLAEVSARIREAELYRLTCSANPDAELEHQDALQALMNGRYESGIVHLEAADKVLSVAPYVMDLR
jgi:TRAP-type C4-dicarboxylate transport system substrate-binding protein